MREITLKGSPGQRGLEHGRAFTREIKSAYHAICKPIKENWDEAKGKILYKLLKNVEGLFSDLVEEIKGISEGSRMPFEDILLLNFYHGLGAVDFKCTNLGFYSKEHGIIHGKTGDAERYLSPFYLLETVYPDKGAFFISICFVGTVWTEAGVNSIGLSCGQSSCPTIEGQDGRGIPCLVMPRPLLQHCSSVKTGIEFLAKYSMAGKGLNIFLADSKGDAAVVEKTYTKQAVRKIKDGVVWNTNHFLDEGLAEYNSKKGEEGLKESKARYDYLQKVLKEERVSHTIEDMKTILRNHMQPGVICKHAESEEATTTHFGAVFIPAKRKALITHGNPCENEFKEYKI
jgi:predicted choloylglycine hydrolase